ncbi:uncharacterized protein C8R40DRAFT_842790 [Lentinula edodes]|uniref:uncharacterized protein n=1 Tax=Lentinula edodes TaxID=5353 RepID=UPI001E8E546F|nr:uncharacterized protein C8R40DRAFT_842790 [Lentinula edodes]KAH7868402.1 hypothetical protein C8R40DRAFT_842790 [Lentinula edodes]
MATVPAMEQGTSSQLWNTDAQLLPESNANTTLNSASEGQKNLDRIPEHERSFTTLISATDDVSNATREIFHSDYNSQSPINRLEMSPASNANKGLKRDFRDGSYRSSHSPLGNGATAYESANRIRDVVLPLVLENFNLRGGAGGNHLSKDVLGAAQCVLTDEVCHSIEMQMVEAQKQLREARVPESHPRLEVPHETTDGSLPDALQLSVPERTSPPHLNGRLSSSNTIIQDGDGDYLDWRPSKRRRIDTISVSPSPISPRQSSVKRSHLPTYSLSGQTSPNAGKQHQQLSVSCSPKTPINRSPSAFPDSVHDHSMCSPKKLPSTNLFQPPYKETTSEAPSSLSLHSQLAHASAFSDQVETSPSLPRQSLEVERPDNVDKLQTLPINNEDTSVPLKVPGIWGIGKSLANPGILEFIVDVDIKTAHAWCLSPDSQDPSKNSFEGWIPLHTWPAQGSLLVDINHGKSEGQIWLPHYLGSENIPLDITNAIQQGQNKIRCIQLSPLQHIFAVHASIPPEPAPIHTEDSSDSTQFEVEIVVDYG